MSSDKRWARDEGGGSGLGYPLDLVPPPPPPSPSRPWPHHPQVHPSSLERMGSSQLGHQGDTSPPPIHVPPLQFSERPTCVQLTAALRDHSFEELDSQNMVNAALTSQLAKEAENGRLLRLLVKLSTITERADADMHWAETGAVLEP